jgi:hypothetical protein
MERQKVASHPERDGSGKSKKFEILDGGIPNSKSKVRRVSISTSDVEEEETPRKCNRS